MSATKMSLGFELELEIPKTRANGMSACLNLAKNVLNSLELGSITYDSTINNGFEFVSKVFHNEDSLENYKNLFNKFEEIQADVTGNHIGMHVHVGKKDISQEEARKINFFIFRNPDFIQKIGERSPTKYCSAMENKEEWAEINNNNNNSDLRYFASIGSDFDHKYRLVNIARPVTVEFRFFKSTANFGVFCKNIQFVKALISFIKESSLSEEDFRTGGTHLKVLTMDNIKIGKHLPEPKEVMLKVCEKGYIVSLFCGHVRKNRGDYLELDKFLEANGMLTKFKAKKLSKGVKRG